MRLLTKELSLKLQYLQLLSFPDCEFHIFLDALHFITQSSGSAN